MSDQDELRDRIAEVIVRKGRTGNSAAQAIIDEFGLTHEVKGKGDDERTYFQRIVGKWEKQ